MGEEQTKYLIPKDLRSQIKFGTFTITDIGIMIGAVLVWYMIINSLELGYAINGLLLIFHLFIGLFLIMRTADNPDRARISVMYSAIVNQDDTKYRSIDYQEYVHVKEEE